MSNAEDKSPDRERTALWAGLGVGLGVASFAGFLTLLVLFFKRKKKRRRSRAMVDATQTNGLSLGWPFPPQLPPLPAPGMISDNNANVFSTYTVPPMSQISSAARKIAGADNLPYVVVVRAVAPPGAFIIICDDPAALVGENAAIPTGSNAIIPVGSDMQIHLAPHQYIYAKGSEPGCIVSVTKAPNLVA